MYTGVEATNKDDEKLPGCESLVIKKGNYISKVIHDYPTHVEKISEAFQALLTDPRIDHENGYYRRNVYR